VRISRNRTTQATRSAPCSCEGLRGGGVAQAEDAGARQARRGETKPRHCHAGCSRGISRATRMRSPGSVGQALRWSGPLQHVLEFVTAGRRRRHGNATARERSGGDRGAILRQCRNSSHSPSPASRPGGRRPTCADARMPCRSRAAAARPPGPPAVADRLGGQPASRRTSPASVRAVPTDCHSSTDGGVPRSQRPRSGITGRRAAAPPAAPADAEAEVAGAQAPAPRFAASRTPPSSRREAGGTGHQRRGRAPRRRRPPIARRLAR